MTVPFTASDLEAISKILTPDFHRDTPYADVKNWEKSLQTYYISELNVVDQDGIDSSFQYYLIIDENFQTKISQYTEITRNMSDDDLSKYMDWHTGHENFRHNAVEKNLKGMKEPYRLARRIVALEYRALIEAIKINELSKELLEDAIVYCHRNLASSFNQNYDEI